MNSSDKERKNAWKNIVGWSLFATLSSRQMSKIEIGWPLTGLTSCTFKVHFIIQECCHGATEIEHSLYKIRYCQYKVWTKISYRSMFFVFYTHQKSTSGSHKSKLYRDVLSPHWTLIVCISFSHIPFALFVMREQKILCLNNSIKFPCKQCYLF